MGIGIDELVKQGHLKHLLPGPLYWCVVPPLLFVLHTGLFNCSHCTVLYTALPQICSQSQGSGKEGISGEASEHGVCRQLMLLHATGLRHSSLGLCRQ